MPAQTLRRGVLPCLALLAAAGLAHADVAEDCANVLIAPEARLASCEVAIETAIDSVEKAKLIVERAEANRLSGDHDAVLADLAEAERLAPDAPPDLRVNMLVQRSEVFRRRDDFDAALADIAEAEQLVPTDADPVVNHGLVLHDQGDLGGAVAQLARAVELEPDNDRAVLISMYVLHAAGDDEACLKHADKAMKIAPGRPQTWSYRGDCLFGLGRFDEAIVDYEKSLAIGSTNPSDKAAVLDNISMSYLAVGRAQDALEAARQSVELNPTSESAQMSLVSALVETGAVEEAIAAFRSAQEAGVEDTMGQANNLAWSLYLAGHYEEALPIMEEWLAAHPAPSGDQYYELDTMAHLQAAVGQTSDAIQTFKRALKVGGPELQAHYEARLTELGFAPGSGGAGLEVALQACVASGAECRISP